MQDLVDHIYDQLECKHNISKEFIKLILEAIIRFDKKQDVYQIENINEFGESGLLFGINNRFKEIKKYFEVDESKRNELMLTEEKIKKDYFDIAIFSFIAYLYKNNKWK